MTINASRPEVTTSPTPLTASRERDATPGRSVLILNPGPTAVVLGGSNVEADTGFPLEPDVPFSADLGKDEAIYGIVASGTQVVYVFQGGL